MSPSPEIARKTIETVWRIESARLIGGLARLVRDVGLAEDLAQEALLVALERWPESGIPDNPGAWLMATAKNRALDQLRRRRMLERKHEVLAGEASLDHVPATGDIESTIDEDVGDDLLRLMLIACHPVLSREARVALTLRLLGGLSAEEIARAFLVPEPTIAQRIVRAKRTLAEARVPFEVPRGEDLSRRLESVLEVIYLIFNEGYAATSGDDWMRPSLCEDALRLGRILAEFVPEEAEVHGLVALMEIQASRTRARTDARGQPVLLLDQDRARWDQLLIRRGLAALAQAESLVRPLGPYTLQAAIAACHAQHARRRKRTGSALLLSTMPSLSSRSRRWSSSIALSPSAWHTDPPRHWQSSTTSWTSACSTTITCCRASGATCSPSSGAPRKRRPSSSEQRPWPGTCASVSCSLRARSSAGRPANGGVIDASPTPLLPGNQR